VVVGVAIKGYFKHARSNESAPSTAPTLEQIGQTFWLSTALYAIFLALLTYGFVISMRKKEIPWSAGGTHLDRQPVLFVILANIYFLVIAFLFGFFVKFLCTGTY